MKKFLAIAGILFTLILTGSSQSFAIGQNGLQQQLAESDSIRQAAADSVWQAELETMVRSIVQSELARQEYAQPSTFSASWNTFLEKSVEILAVVSPFIMVTLIVFFSITGSTKRRRIKYEMVEKAIDKGYQIPEYVFYEKPKEKSEKSSLSTAITLIAVGFAVSMYFLIDEDPELAALTSMVMLIGIGKLIVYILDERQKRKIIDKQIEMHNRHDDAKQD